MNARQSQERLKGFTLIEMIGVLAAFILPTVFEFIVESKVDGLVSAAHTYKDGITKYYTDMGRILPLNAKGTPQPESSGDSSIERSLPAPLTLPSSDPLVLDSNLRGKFHGPYLERFDSDNPPELGTQRFMPARKTKGYGETVTGNNRGWDLKGDDGKNDIPSDANVVYLRVTGLSEGDFLVFDKVVDTTIGSTDADRKLRGRAKWSPQGNGTLYLYLARR